MPWDIRTWCYLRLDGRQPAVSLFPVLQTADSPSFITCHYLPSFYTDAKSWWQRHKRGDYFPADAKFSGFSTTFPVRIATLLSMYVSMIAWPIQLVVSNMSRKTTTLPERSENSEYISYLEPVTYCGTAIANRQTKLKLHFIIQCVCPRRPAKTDYGLPWLFPIFPDHFAIPWLLWVFQVSAQPDKVVNNLLTVAT